MERMSHWNNLPQLRLGVYPTPFTGWRISAPDLQQEHLDQAGRPVRCRFGQATRSASWNICWRTPSAGLRHRVHHRRGPSPTMPCSPPPAAARLGLRCVLLLKKRGVTDRKGQSGAGRYFRRPGAIFRHRRYEDIYAEMNEAEHRAGEEGHKGYIIPVGGSTPPWAPQGMSAASGEIAQQAKAAGMRPAHLASATGSAPPPDCCLGGLAGRRRPRSPASA